MIIFPMAGLSSRFATAGFTRPKYMLEARGESVFHRAVKGFSQYFDSTPFLFIVRDIADTVGFVADECDRLGLRNRCIVTLPGPTSGQAETVALGLRALDDQADGPMTVFNIDTFRHNFRHPPFVEECDGYLEVFRGEGEHWSFVEPSPEGGYAVARTTEKDRISDLCCTGLYHFGSRRDFLEACDRATKDDSLQVRGEIYIAPLYNLLLSHGRRIRYHLIDSAHVAFCGTPAEYEQFLAAQDIGLF